MSKENNLTDFLTDLANAIRNKKGITGNINPQNFASEIASIEASGGDNTIRTTYEVVNVFKSNWTAKTWTGLTNFSGTAIWTDGKDIYCSDSIGGAYKTYKLNKETSEWTYVRADGVAGNKIWTNGRDIYYSNGSTHKKFNQQTKTWGTTSFGGLTSFNGGNVWSDGANIYHTASGTSHKLTAGPSGDWQYWSSVTISAPHYKDGSRVYNYWSGANIWGAGNEVYAYGCSFIASTMSFSGNHLTGLDEPSGIRVWSDGTNIYYSSGSNQLVFDPTTETWTAKTWTGLTSFEGDYVWTDGTNIYYSNGTTHYVLDKKSSGPSTAKCKTILK